MVTVHCDHLITAFEGALADTNLAKSETPRGLRLPPLLRCEVRPRFLGPRLRHHDHQVILENYAFPGLMIIGTDSHTPNAGGLEPRSPPASAVADAVDVMAGFPWEVLYPRLIGVRLTGSMSGWTAPKDIILIRYAGILTVSGGTNAVVEYFGPGVNSISATGKATICNMGAELGATTSIFPYDEHAAAYLRATGRPELAELAGKYAHLLTGDAEVEAEPDKYFDRVIEIDLDTLEPHVVGCRTRRISPAPSRSSPTPSSRRTTRTRLSAAHPHRLLHQLLVRGGPLAPPTSPGRPPSTASGRRVDFLVTPGSEAVNATIQRDGQMAALESCRQASVMANACGPCIGQWKRPTISALGDVPTPRS